MEKFQILYDTPLKSWYSSCVGDHLMVLTLKWDEIWVGMAFMKYRYYTIWKANFPNLDAYISLIKTERISVLILVIEEPAVPDSAFYSHS